MRKLLILLASSAALAVSAAPGSAAGGPGCSDFLWPLETELSWMKSADSEKVASGTTLAAPPKDKAIEIALRPAGEVSFPARPTSTQKPEDKDAFAGVVSFEGNAEPIHYQVTLSANGWIDVVQNGAPLDATGHTGSKDCDGLRKSVRFEVAPGPFAIQVNGVRATSIRIAVRPAAD